MAKRNRTPEQEAQRKEYMREYYLRNGAQLREYNNTRYHEDGGREKQRKHRLKKDYGLTVEEYDAMRASQNFKCPLCLEEEATDVDHCHDDGRVRGVLCPKCNKGIGLLMHNPDIFARAIEYVNDRTDRRTAPDAQAAA